MSPSRKNAFHPHCGTFWEIWKAESSLILLVVTAIECLGASGHDALITYLKNLSNLSIFCNTKKDWIHHLMCTKLPNQPSSKYFRKNLEANWSDQVQKIRGELIHIQSGEPESTTMPDLEVFCTTQRVSGSFWFSRIVPGDIFFAHKWSTWNSKFCVPALWDTSESELPF